MIRAHVLVCGGTGCTSSGSNGIQEAFTKNIAEFGLENEVKLDTREIKAILSPVPINTYEVLLWIEENLREQYSEFNKK